MTRVHINRQIGNYVIWSKKKDTPAFYVRIAGEENDADQAISTHAYLNDAIAACDRYIDGDKRRRRDTIR